MFQTLGLNDIALDLSRLLEIRKQDHVGEAKDNTFFELGQFSPMFVQLMMVIIPLSYYILKDLESASH
jgi:hypothetical protein